MFHLEVSYRLSFFMASKENMLPNFF